MRAIIQPYPGTRNNSETAMKTYSENICKNDSCDKIKYKTWSKQLSSIINKYCMLLTVKLFYSMDQLLYTFALKYFFPQKYMQVVFLI